MITKEGILSDKVCLITGTSRGIGREIAKRFLEEGAIVYANARTEGCLDEWVSQINPAEKDRLIPVYFDVTSQKEIRKSILRLKREAGRIDILVNNAGLIFNEALGMSSLDRTREMFEVNVFGLLELTQLVSTRFMMKQKSGSIINIASITGVEGSRGQTAYSASKGAVIALTKSMAKELASYSIRVNAIAPGMIQTERLKVSLKEEYKTECLQAGMGRLGEPEEIADGCLYFASDLSSYTTGQVLVIGGGYHTSDRSRFEIEFKE